MQITCFFLYLFRRRADLIISLLSLMISTGLPELNSEQGRLYSLADTLNITIPIQYHKFILNLHKKFSEKNLKTIGSKPN